MRKNLRPIAALFAACAILLAGGAVRTQADTPRQAAINAAAKAKSAVDAARRAHAEAEKATVNKERDANKKMEAERKTLEEAQAALKAAQQALAAIPEDQDLTTRRKVGDQLDELDAILKVLDFIENVGLDAAVSFVPPGDADAKKRAEETVSKAFDEVEKAINKLPPEKRKDLQKQIEDRQKELLGKLAFGAIPGKPSDTYASLARAGKVTDSEGLRIVTFDTPPGQIRVYLPDDMRAGDTISGTVVAEPKGQTPDERAKNMAVLSGCVIEVQPPRKLDGTSNPKVKAQVTAAPSPFTFTLPPSSTPTPPLKNVSSANSSGLGITLTNTSGSFIGGTTTVPIEMVSLSLQSVAPLKLPQLPSIGQQGRPIEIIGPFDGNSSNTILNWTRVRSQVQDFEKNTENVSGGFGLIAESPRKAVFRAPANVTGPIEINLKEENKETKGTFRNVGVNLTSPKTSLLKGESTELHVEVSGLQGITEPVPLHLTKGGVVTMQGGDVQTMSIKPAEVQANGTFTTTRTITGVQTGAWNATATVVVFDICLQDDNNGNSIVLSRETGDYKFCMPPPKISPDFEKELLKAARGAGTVSTDGCMTKLEDLASTPPGRRVLVYLDRCALSGSATIELGSGKTITITDRDTRNNTCACK